MKKVVSYFLLLIISFSICTSCKKEKDLVIYRNFYDQDITTLNYLVTNLHTDYTHFANFIDGLVENDKYGNIVPSLAKSWDNKIENGKEVWTFNIREDAYWSDYKGNKYEKVTAHDFVTSIKYLLNYNTRSDNYSLPSKLIENGQNYYYGTLLSNYNDDQIINSNDRKILEAYKFCLTTTCITDFSLVGIKAINDYTLQIVLNNPTIYFLSSLTNYSFLPVNEKFIKEIGFNNFGTNKKYLLYCGAYILNEYYHTSKIEYIKNDNYWDKDKVYIDKIIFSKLQNYPSLSYSRLAYETGNIDSFYVSKLDETGWKKYVTGSNNEGNEQSPIADNTFVLEETTDFTTYHLIMNQNRVKDNYTKLSKSELELANKAMSNTNFRKAILHALNVDIYSLSYLNKSISSIVPKGFINNNGKDYHDYYLQEYASSNNVSYQEVLIKDSGNSLIKDYQKSQHYLNIALEELNIEKSNLPIKIEYTYYYNQDYVSYELMRIKEWNNILNGCSLQEDECEYNKVFIVYNDTLKSYGDFSYAITNGEYHLSYLGLYPNYMDPVSYLEALSINGGEIYPYINHNIKDIDDMLEEINQYNQESYLDKRYELCAQLEYKIIFEYALILPLYTKETENKILVSNLMPYQRMVANYGLSPYKFKLRKMREKDYTQEDILKLKEEYERELASQ